MQNRGCKDRKKKWVTNLYGGTGSGERRCSNVSARYMRWYSKSFAGMERAWVNLSCWTYRNPKGKLITASFISEWSGAFFNCWITLFSLPFFSVSKSKNPKRSCVLWRWKLSIVMKSCPLSCRFARLLQPHTSYTHNTLEDNVFCINVMWECSAVGAVPPGENLSWHLTTLQ